MNLPKLIDVSCSGAKTDQMTQPQTLLIGAANPPQFDALDNMTGIVTLTIGGNDVGYWSTIADVCLSTTPAGTPCQDQFVVNGQDKISQLIAGAAPKVAACSTASTSVRPGPRCSSWLMRPSSPRALSLAVVRKAAILSSHMPRGTCRTCARRRRRSTR